MSPAPRERVVQSAVGGLEPESVCLIDREERERIPFDVCFFKSHFSPQWSKNFRIGMDLQDNVSHPFF